MLDSERTYVSLLKVTLRFFGGVGVASEHSSSSLILRLGLRGGPWVALVHELLFSGVVLVASFCDSRLLVMLMMAWASLGGVMMSLIVMKK